MFSSHGYLNHALAVFVLFFPVLGSAHRCSDKFIMEIYKFGINENFCSVKALKAEFGWRFNNSTRQLDIAFGAKIDTETGWIAWGLNPYGPHMVGTRALIGVKRRNGTLDKHQYSITAATKHGCQLLPSEDIELDVKDFRFVHMVNIGYYVILATVSLSKEYNASGTNVVWQVAEPIVESGPRTHAKTLENFDAAEVMDFTSNKVISYTAHQLRQIRTAHGLSNIGGWGVFLPIGVIASRYFRSFPIKSQSWFMLHVGCQVIGYIIGVVGWGIGLWLGRTSKYYVFRTHRTIAIFIFTFTTIQMLSLRLKPKFNDEYREYWNMYHHFLGYSLLVLICINIFYGIRIFEPYSAWKWSYIGLLGMMGIVALVLESYTWIKFGYEKIRNLKGNPAEVSNNQKPGKRPRAHLEQPPQVE